MRRQFHIVPAAICVMAIGLMAQSGYAGISGSKHDFGQFGWANNQICLPCHTPHGAIVRDANGQLVGGPLWNHTLTSRTTYDLYLDWETGTVISGAVDTNSRLCLSCHDGTVAVDSFGGGAGTQQLTGGLLGTDLSDDHPIGEAAIWWTTTPPYMVDPALRTAAGIMPLRKMSDGRLAVGCTSCHEPHNRKNTTYMLWVRNDGPATTVDGRSVTGSALCMNCHKK
jgi:hypothetical protein